MGSTFRDRTAEFYSLSQTLKKIGAIPSVHHQYEDDPASSKQSPPGSSRSEFNKKASRTGLGLHETLQKISRLDKLAKQSSIFNDRTVEIQELTVLIRNDITGLNMALSDLETLQNMEIADGNYSQDKVGHYTAVRDDLKTRLMAATKQFQDVLTTRSENMKAHENRKQLFSTKNAVDSPPQSNAKSVPEPPPWSTSPNPGNLQQPLLPPNSGAPSGSQLRRRSAIENAPSQQMEMAMLQQTVPRQENYSQSRAVALHSVESTITELSGIFTHLATMVTQQGELAIRIDDNMDESLVNVEGARSALLQHLTRISSNRWLMMKIFALLILFLIVFLFFVA
ncbi:PREDICTED: syntaxin-31-like [Camelina sativa]|uniref:Syntaxin-31-like n=1 Tax=Camelina sativa TaxID=90675 RepID=A0ABM0XU91_CAMSA|nr:PREDICTED: syntaxin-31-like [Camelina sativa]